MSTRIESRTFLRSSASFKIIKTGILLSLVRRFEMNKTHHCVLFLISAPLSKIELKARQMATSKSDIIQFFCSQTIENDHTSRSVWLFIDIDL